MDAIFDALDNTELFDSFVRASMERNLVKEYEQLGLEHDSILIIRARISGILCQAGFRGLTELQKHAANKRSEAVKRDGMITRDLFEISTVMSMPQHGGYLGMAAVYDFFGATTKASEAASLGLNQLETARRSTAGQAMLGSNYFPHDYYDRIEQKLRSFLKDGAADNNHGTSFLLMNVADEKARRGRRGICMLCGTIKSGSFVHCKGCGFQPISAREIAIALLLNEATMRNFEQIAEAIKSGQYPEYSDDDILLFTESAIDAQRLTGLSTKNYRVRAQTENFLESSGQVALNGTANAIAMLDPSVLGDASELRMLAVVGEMLKATLINIVADGEKSFIGTYYRKRLLLTYLRHRSLALSGISMTEFTHRFEKAHIDFDHIKLDVDADRYQLERTVIPFVLANFDPALSYMKNSHADPTFGMYLRNYVDTFANIIGQKATNWP